MIKPGGFLHRTWNDFREVHGLWVLRTLRWHRVLAMKHQPDNPYCLLYLQSAIFPGNPFADKTAATQASPLETKNPFLDPRRKAQIKASSVGCPFSTPHTGKALQKGSSSHGGISKNPFLMSMVRFKKDEIRWATNANVPMFPDFRKWRKAKKWQYRRDQRSKKRFSMLEKRR